MFENGIYQWRESVGKQLSVAISGDICPWKSAEQVILDGKSSEILKGIQPALDKADLRIAQWETVITDKLNPITKAGPNLSVAPGCEAFLTAGKFDVGVHDRVRSQEFAGQGRKRPQVRKPDALLRCGQSL